MSEIPKLTADVAGEAIEGLTRNQKWMLRGKIGTVVASSLFIAGTSILDMAKRKEDNKIMENEKIEQLKEQQRKQKITSRAKKDVYKDIAKKSSGGYYKSDLGQTVIDLFNERTGHYKMGNSRF